MDAPAAPGRISRVRTCHHSWCFGRATLFLPVEAGSFRNRNIDLHRRCPCPAAGDAAVPGFSFRRVRGGPVISTSFLAPSSGRPTLDWPQAWRTMCSPRARRSTSHCGDSGLPPGDGCRRETPSKRCECTRGRACLSPRSQGPGARRVPGPAGSSTVKGCPGRGAPGGCGPRCRGVRGATPAAHGSRIIAGQ